MKQKFNAIFKALTFMSLLISSLSLPQFSYAHPCRHCSQELTSPKTCAGCSIAHYCSRECQVTHWSSHKGECKKLAQARYLKGKVRVAPSLLPDSGQGLFAEQDFQRGDELTAYYGTLVKPTLPSRLVHGSHSYLQPIASSQYLLLGDPHPPAAHLAAQLANDPYVSAQQVRSLLNVPCASLTPEYLEGIQQFASQYMQNWINDQLIFRGTLSGKSKANIDLETMVDVSYFPRMIARRSITQGEELYYDYGVEYWLGMPISLCNKKGMPEAGLAIERAFSQALEENYGKHPYFYELIKTNSANYISQTQFDSEKESYPSDTTLRFTRLFGSAEIIVLDPETNPTLALAKEFTPLIDLLIELKEIPNSEFMDSRYYGKPHPKSIIVLEKFVDHLKSKGLHTIPTFVDPFSKESYTWEDILRLFQH